MEEKYIVYGAIRLGKIRGPRRRFFMELHDYLKANMSNLYEGKCPWTCGCNHFDDSPYTRHRHFINFCKQQKVDWLFAHETFCAMYGPFHCDCDYLYNLKITDDDVEFIDEQVTPLSIN